MLYNTKLITKEDELLVRRPMSECYVNTQYKDKSTPHLEKISRLMEVFRDNDKYDDMFPAFSERKRLLHETEEGVRSMSVEIQRFRTELSL
ncbi:MAG: hypothetical protein IJ679_01025 [Lachnospiraceae bacterium]|nr:hypothetical protein [Lachnospiraceae bacterium]